MQFCKRRRVDNFNSNATLEVDNITVDELTATSTTTQTLEADTIVVDSTNTEALLVRKDGDSGDIFTVDTTNAQTILNGASIIDGTSTEALLVRKVGDSGDIFTVDTTNNIVKADSLQVREITEAKGGQQIDFIAGNYITFMRRTVSVDGLATSPAISFTNNTNSGIYRSGADDIRLSVAGADALGATTSDITHYNNAKFPDGAVGTPSISFTSDTDTGAYLAGVGDLRVTVGGTDRIAFDSGITMSADMINTGQPAFLNEAVAASGTLAIATQYTMTGQAGTGVANVLNNTPILMQGGVTWNNTTGVITLPSAGVYFIFFNAMWLGATNQGYHQIWARDSAGNDLGNVSMRGDGFLRESTAFCIQLAASETIEFILNHNASGTLTLQHASTLRSSVGVVKLF